MVKFVQRLDRNKKIYIVKALREAGFSPTIVINPNRNAAVMYPKNADLSSVLRSIDVIRQDLLNELQEQQ